MCFVNRRLEEDTPVATYHSLTPKGESLRPVSDAIGDCAKEWTVEESAASGDV